MAELPAEDHTALSSFTSSFFVILVSESGHSTGIAGKLQDK
jgi:hypothetical protein